MSKQLSQVKDIIDELKLHLQKKLPVNNIFLFGSAARDEMKKDSDVDIIVISTKFSKMQFMRRLQLLSRVSMRCSDKAAFDIIGYTPREFEELKKSDSPNVKKIFREGRMMY